MTRKTIDCRAFPNDVGCTLAISGEPDELVTAAAQHAVAVHGHADTRSCASSCAACWPTSRLSRGQGHSSSSSSSKPTASPNGT